jgi:hypothetical protein
VGRARDAPERQRATQFQAPSQRLRGGGFLDTGEDSGSRRTGGRARQAWATWAPEPGESMPRIQRMGLGVHLTSFQVGLLILILILILGSTYLRGQRVIRPATFGSPAPTSAIPTIRCPSASHSESIPRTRPDIRQTRRVNWTRSRS